LGYFAEVDPRYEANWGWTRGTAHAVVFFGRAEGNLVEMGDPTVGRERWGRESIDVLWTGVGMRLVAPQTNR